MSEAVYEDGLLGDDTIRVRDSDGSSAPLGADRWRGPARGADRTLLDRVDGPTLDIGCGPGRLVVALLDRGIPCLGVDPAAASVELTRSAGGHAVQRSVFDPLPRSGEWACALLADGNIGIGGNPVRLLRRAGELVRPGGRVLVELDPPRSGSRRRRIRLEDGAGRVGEWFPWAHLAADEVDDAARAAGMVVLYRWWAHDVDGDGSSPIRWFAALTRPA
jgi:SAM-dependent methyltransferase